MTPEHIRAAAAEVRAWLKTLLITFAVIWLIQRFFFNLSIVQGASMQPTLIESEWLFVNKFIYLLHEPNRGEIVVLNDPTLQGGARGERIFLVKRVIAVAGDTVEIREGKLYLNGKPQVEGYTDSDIQDGDFGPFRVNEGYVFVMGDNRHSGKSEDSRVFGQVPLEAVQGKAQWALWPFSKAGAL
ncbi:signal peptidase I [Paenibacillus turpanensis]|uniref:signal peptidase I n=1 Tax=Paenibacillus turpanensis TaxID=2689078 RepID=UPI00140AACA3|nr:signal peptidase I [Paenibacillus turpanensis]